MNDRVRQGHDPDWRIAFHDRLDPAAQARVRHAVTAVECLADPTEAAIAVGLARRQQRMLLRYALIVLPLQIGLAITWLWMLLPPAPLPVAFRWFWVVVLALLVGVIPLVLRHRHLQARRAIDANHDAAGR